jgi:hypothetical protein
MKLTLEPTEHFFMAGEVMVRMWQGSIIGPDGLEQGAVALVAAVMTGAGSGVATFEAESGLISIPPPDHSDAARWAKAVLGRPAGGYIDSDFAERACDHCGTRYRGPSVYCSPGCVEADR